MTSLHLAAIFGFNEILKLLVSHGADPKSVAGRDTPLHKAALFNNKECAETLLQMVS